jgi:shikimate kinase
MNGKKMKKSILNYLNKYKILYYIKNQKLLFWKVLDNNNKEMLIYDYKESEEIEQTIKQRENITNETNNDLVNSSSKYASYRGMFG